MQRKMSEGYFQRNRLYVNVGATDHVDHGKTILATALTTVLAERYGGGGRAYQLIDNAPKEEARVTTINAPHI